MLSAATGEHESPSTHIRAVVEKISADRHGVPLVIYAGTRIQGQSSFD